MTTPPRCCCCSFNRSWNLHFPPCLLLPHHGSGSASEGQGYPLTPLPCLHALLCPQACNATSFLKAAPGLPGSSLSLPRLPQPFLLRFSAPQFWLCWLHTLFSAICRETSGTCLSPFSSDTRVRCLEDVAEVCCCLLHVIYFSFFKSMNCAVKDTVPLRVHRTTVVV